MQNSEAVQAWFQGKMASFRILGLVSKNEIRSREFSFSSKSESEDNKTRYRLDARDWRKFFLGLVSKPESKCQEFSVSSRWTRLTRRNSHSRLVIEKTTLADHCFKWLLRSTGWHFDFLCFQLTLEDLYRRGRDNTIALRGTYAQQGLRLIRHSVGETSKSSTVKTSNRK